MKNIIAIFLTILLIIILYTFYYLLSDDRSENGNEISFINNNKHVEEDDVSRLNRILMEKEIEEMFWVQRINLAEEEHFNLILNLQDSLLSLEIKGISIHQSQVHQFNFSEILDLKTNPVAKNVWLQMPFQLIAEWSTIPKRPIRKIDVSEVADLSENLSYIPVKSDTEDVMIVLQFSDSLRLGLKQSEELSADDYFLSRFEESQSETDHIRVDSTESKKFTELLGKKWIVLEALREDLIAIYRAINQDTQLLICP